MIEASIISQDAPVQLPFIMNTLNSTGLQLSHDLIAGRHHETLKNGKRKSQQKVHIVGAGATLTAAYEQLRIAAEYTEENVLLQRAIRRFYRRLFLLRDMKRIKQSGEELVIELTQAGYLANDSVSEDDVESISKNATEYYETQIALYSQTTISHEVIDKWTIDVLSVEIEERFNEHSRHRAFVQFAFTYFSQTIDFENLVGRDSESHEVSLYIALHRALLKSDDATMRSGLLKRYRADLNAKDQYVELNQRIDAVLSSDATEKLFRVVDRRGAHIRVLRHMIEDNPDIIDLLPNREQFLTAYEQQVRNDYQTVNERINKGIIKSVIFLIITKFLIGIAVEVPYDYILFGTILWIPLIINLFFPPLYMVMLRATMMLPGAANTARLVEQIDQTLYGNNQAKQLIRRPRQEFGAGYNVAYGLLFVAVFGGAALLLWRLAGFDVVHLLIFFTFLSAASFLGFRLSRMIRELESIETYQNGVTLTRDFLYMPFVVVGRFLSEKYAKVNVVALALDMLIELPLKTVLRLVRQWAAFISAKKDQL